MLDEEVEELAQNVVRLWLLSDLDRPAFSCVCIDQRQYLYGSTAMRSRVCEVVDPHVICVRGTKSDTGSIVEAEMPSFWLFLRGLEALATPDSLNSRAVDVLALGSN